MKPKKDIYRFKKFFELFEHLGIIKSFIPGIPDKPWTYKQHNEAVRIANELKDKIKK